MASGPVHIYFSAVLGYDGYGENRLIIAGRLKKTCVLNYIPLNYLLLNDLEVPFCRNIWQSHDLKREA